jgi:hypothetical protein
LNENADFNFNNKHFYINTCFQFSARSISYQIGLKNNFVNFVNINSNNSGYFGNDMEELKNSSNIMKRSTQIYQDLGIYPINDNNWFSIHTGFSISGRLPLSSQFKTRAFGGYLSIMVNPSKLLKWKK